MNATGPTLNTSQAAILSVLAKSPTGMTADQIKSRVGNRIGVNADTLGPATLLLAEEGYPDSLHGKGLVRAGKLEGGETIYRITTEGKEYAQIVKYRRPVQDKHKIPSEILDPAVLKVKSTRTYVFERYTDEDIDAIKTLLGDEWDHISRQDVKEQIVTRRKVGAYSDPEQKGRKAAKAAIAAFGPEGSVQANLLTPEVIRRLNAIIHGE